MAKRVKVRKRNGVWEVNPNGVAGFNRVSVHRTYSLAVFDLDVMCYYAGELSSLPDMTKVTNNEGVE